MAIANRTRSECISFRLTSEERALFDTRRKLSGLKMHEFLVELLKKKKFVVKPGGDIVVVQLKRIGNNLNQIAHKVNAGQIKDCRAELRQIRDELARLRTAWQ